MHSKSVFCLKKCPAFVPEQRVPCHCVGIRVWSARLAIEQHHGISSRSRHIGVSSNEDHGTPLDLESNAVRSSYSVWQP